MSRLPTYFISHGGGPWPWMPDWRAEFAPLEASLAAIPQQLKERPRAVLCISGHWEADAFTVMTSPQPPMIYDYSGFPAETYDVSYPAPGAPLIAQETANLISAAGLPVQMDDRQGYDHGTFVPVSIMYPDADIPVLQVSMRHSYDPQDHFALGRALSPLRDQGVLIIGSGLSYHNLRAFGPAAKVPSEAFDVWLAHALAQPADMRTNALLDWETAPYARECHAQEDHFVPIFAALGAAEDAKATRIYHQKNIFGGVTASGYRFD